MARVTVHVNNRRVEVSPACEAELEPALSAQLLRPRPAADGTFVTQRTRRRYYTLANGKLKTAPDLAARVRRRLEECGHEVIHRDQRLFVVPEGKCELPDNGLTTEQRRMLATVAAVPRGQLVVRGQAEEWARLIHLLLAEDSRTRTLIVPASTRDAHSVHSKLSRALGAPVQLLERSRRPQAELCVVDPCRFNCGTCFLPEMRWGTVIVLDRRAILQKLVRRNLSPMREARAYLFVNDEAVNAADELDVEQMVGPVIFREHSPSVGPPSVQVELLHVPEPPETWLERIAGPSSAIGVN